MRLVERLRRHPNADKITRYAGCRAEGLTLSAAGDAAGVSLATAYRYEKWLLALARELHITVDGIALSADALTRIREAISGPARPETASSQQAHTTPLEGVTAP